MNEDEEKCLRSWGFHFFKMSEIVLASSYYYFCMCSRSFLFSEPATVG